MKVLPSLALALMAAILPARAAIVFHIDTTAEEFYFSGTDTGTAIFGGGNNYAVAWSNDGEAGGNIEFTDVITAFNASAGTLVSVNFAQSDIGYANLVLFVTNDQPLDLTVTADDSVRFSYAGYTEWRQVQFAALAASGEPFAVNPGNTGFSDLDVVPEPSTYALLALGASFLAFRFLRRRQTC